MSNKSINLTGNKRVVKRWAVPRPAGYFTVGREKHLARLVNQPYNKIKIMS